MGALCLKEPISDTGLDLCFVTNIMRVGLNTQLDVPLPVLLLDKNDVLSNQLDGMAMEQTSFQW